jgi:hypothetical protein
VGGQAVSPISSPTRDLRYGCASRGWVVGESTPLSSCTRASSLDSASPFQSSVATPSALAPAGRPRPCGLRRAQGRSGPAPQSATVAHLLPPPVRSWPPTGLPWPHVAPAAAQIGSRRQLCQAQARPQLLRALGRAPPCTASASFGGPIIPHPALPSRPDN